MNKPHIGSEQIELAVTRAVAEITKTLSSIADPLPAGEHDEPAYVRRLMLLGQSIELILANHSHDRAAQDMFLVALLSASLEGLGVPYNVAKRQLPHLVGTTVAAMVVDMWEGPTP